MRSAEAIAGEALSLPIDDRAALVLRLAESLDEEQDPECGGHLGGSRGAYRRR
jgi:hypothetical protein